MALDDALPPSFAGTPLAFDARNLAALRSKVREASGGTSGAERETARQFEALFLQMMIKRMREAAPQDGLFDSDQTRLAQSLADEQLAMQLATPGIGLAQALLNQIQRHRASLDGMDAAEPGDAKGAAVPQAHASRLPGLRSRIGDGADGAPSVGPAVAALLDVLAGKGDRREPAAAEGAPPYVADFVARLAGAARTASRASGVPARLILGQAALESGWGEREIRHPDGRPSHNLFGIKAGPGWNGRVVNVMTTEYENGEPRRMMQSFRAYDSYEASFADYARLIGGSPRYEGVTRARDEVEAAWRIQEAGYATDPRYADKLIGVMGQLRRHPG